MRSMTLYLRSALGANFSQIATFTLGGTNGSTDRPKAPISRIKDELTNECSGAERKNIVYFFHPFVFNIFVWGFL